MHPVQADNPFSLAGGTHSTARAAVVSVYSDDLDEGEAGGGRPTVQGTALLVNPTLGVKVQSNALSLRVGAGYGARKYVQSDLQNLNSFNDRMSYRFSFYKTI